MVCDLVSRNSKIDKSAYRIERLAEVELVVERKRRNKRLVSCADRVRIAARACTATRGNRAGSARVSGARSGNANRAQLGRRDGERGDGVVVFHRLARAMRRVRRFRRTRNPRDGEARARRSPRWAVSAARPFGVKPPPRRGKEVGWARKREGRSTAAPSSFPARARGTPRGASGFGVSARARETTRIRYRGRFTRAAGFASVWRTSRVGARDRPQVRTW